MIICLSWSILITDQSVISVGVMECSQKWQRRKTERPSEILDAALSLFVSKGFVATRLDDIAKKAGVSKGTLYLYFESKELIFQAMVEDMIIPEVDRVEDTVKLHAGSKSALIECLVKQWWEVVGKTRLANIPKLMVSEATHFPILAEYYVKNVVKRMRDMLGEIISDGIKIGEFRNVDVDSAARLLVAPLVFAVIWDKSLAQYDDDNYNMETYIKTHLSIFLSGLRKDAEVEGE